MIRLFTTVLLTAIACCNTLAQDWMHVHFTDRESPWTVPAIVDSISHLDVSIDQQHLVTHLADGTAIPFTLEQLDSITFASELTDDNETRDRYRVFQMYVWTSDGRGITSKDNYTDCHVAISADGAYADRFESAQIRGRGNSTWNWYDKKPYRLKLRKKHKILGLDKAKSWVLLANYRDVTDVMNTFVFETGRWMGLPHTNHTRYVELFIDGDYRGLYQLTEQVQQGSNRVDVSDERGILLTLDVDDGPDAVPNATDNFRSKVFAMPTAVKHPSDDSLTPERRDSIREVFGRLETAIMHQDYATASTLLDMESFVRYLIIQEFIYNVELSAPRSVYLHKDGDGKWVMGPLWDFDAGYDFDWGDMYHGHTFFTNYRETVMGTDPLHRNGNYPAVPQFFTNLFGCKEFVQLYKNTWNRYADSIVTAGWEHTERYLEHLRSGAMRRDLQRWPISGKSFEVEVEKMHTWLINRAAFLDQLINDIPVPEEEPQPITEEELVGVIDVAVTMQHAKGYNQNSKVVIDKGRVLALLGITEAQFQKSRCSIVPLYTDGTPGPNGTNGTTGGGWFDKDGNPGAYAQGHVYIEVFNDLWNWSCGLYKEQCNHDSHTVTMQIQYPVGTTLRKVNIVVHFTIEASGYNPWW